MLDDLNETTFHSAEPQPRLVSTGILAGTMVATASGWRSIDKVAEGDMVLTFDDGMQPVRRVTRRTGWSADLASPDRLWPLMVPKGAIGNTRDMTLMPSQNVMIESDAAEEIWGDPFTVVPAATLDGWRGIARVCPAETVEVITLHFDEDQVIFADGGALVFCHHGGDLIEDALSGRTASRYPVLVRVTADALMEQILFDEDRIGAGLGEAAFAAPAAAPEPMRAVA